MASPATAEVTPVPPRIAHDFNAIYEANVSYVWRAALRLGVPPSSVDDVVQDVFLVAHRKLGTFEARSTIRTWLFGITLRVARKYRTPKKDFVELGPDHPGDEHATSPSEGVERLEGLRLLDHLLSQLDDAKREALVLSEIEQLTVPEIADVLGVNVSTVYSRVAAARKELSEAVKRHRARNARKSGGLHE